MSEQPVNPRTRTVTWRDPREGASAAKTLSGLEYLRAIQRGELPGPPIAELMGFSPVEVEEGRVVFAVKPGEHHYNPIGMVHGGLAATLMDSAMGCAIHTMLPVGAGYTTLELHVNYVKGIAHDTGRLLCRGEVIHLGGRVATAQGRLVDEKGTLYAHGTTTCMVFRPPGAGGKE
ncbi:PaaI family thioesterase [Corallococcus exercitus]|uniref:PaaI family thioesterase n=1 Tax=Corallococcus exercitus TaxID=2316736 RepID=A0A3A8HU79_9BACT|nr:PaaI family thioesterase [Corallococcus exercitus]NOK33397.1 PaaI family thioesterase [Corallococcus exercitus]RKG74747.1 PaaI family thioesterase [Corallococcus exercitus]